MNEIFEHIHALALTTETQVHQHVLEYSSMKLLQVPVDHRFEFALPVPSGSAEIVLHPYALQQPRQSPTVADAPLNDVKKCEDECKA